MGKIFQWIGVKNVNEKFSSILSISASPKPQKSGAPEKLEPFIFYRLTGKFTEIVFTGKLYFSVQ